VTGVGEDAPGEIAGVGALLQQHFTVDDREVNAFGRSATASVSMLISPRLNVVSRFSSSVEEHVDRDDA